MAQTPTLTTDDSPRPLPRRERTSQTRMARPRLQPLDGLWIALLVVLAMVVYALLPHPSLSLLLIPSIFGVVITVALVYLLGWRIRDRATGLVGGLLLATSLPFLESATHSPEGAILAALTVGSLLAFAADFSLAALILAGLATMIQPVDAVLGVVLLLFSLAQHRRRAVAGAVLFFILAVGGNVLLMMLERGSVHPLHWNNHIRLSSLLLTSSSLFLLWFLLPFLGEWTDQVRRSRWLPVFVWMIFSGLAACGLSSGNNPETRLSFLPLLLLIVACGFSRLLPILAGEFNSLPMRYTIATLSALALVALRVPQEWQHSHQLAAPAQKVMIDPVVLTPIPATIPAPQPPIQSAQPPVSVPAKTTVTAPPVHKKPAQIVPLKKAPVKPKAKPLPKHKAVVKPKMHLARKPGVQTFYIRNGRRVYRSRWAIKWHQQHPYGR